MKKCLLVLLGVVIFLNIYQYNKSEKSDVLFNYGIHRFEESAIVEEINLHNCEIVVCIKNSDTYLEAEKNPYNYNEIKLDCSKVKKDVLENIKIYDEIMFTHLYDDPYTVLDFKICEK